MKLKKIAVWGFLLAGVLGVTAGLRDWFAPGFFSMSPRIPGTGTSSVILSPRYPSSLWPSYLQHST
jgi:hypothetical protein